MKVDETDEDLGAPAIMISPRKEVTDLPPGPESDTSAVSPALADQKAELKQTDLPKDTPTEADDANRIVTPNEMKKPVEEEAKFATIQTQASQESVAAEATAAPSAKHVPEGRVRWLLRKRFQFQTRCFAKPMRWVRLLRAFFRSVVDFCSATDHLLLRQPSQKQLAANEAAHLLYAAIVAPRNASRICFVLLTLEESSDEKEIDRQGAERVPHSGGAAQAA